MNPKIKDYAGMTAIAAMALLTLAGLQYASSFSRSVQPSASFSATGEGRAVAVPDMAEFSFGVTTEGGKDIAALQKENTDKVNAQIDYVKSQGVEQKDIRTTNYNISPRYQYYNCTNPESSVRPCPAPEITGYTINQTISVKARDFGKIGDIMSGVTSRGANNISGLNFTVRERDAVESEARAEAITKAKAKAEALARAGHFRLGRIISIQESGNIPSPQPYYAKLEMGRGAGAMDASSAPAIQGGSDDIVVNVSITYEIR